MTAGGQRVGVAIGTTEGPSIILRISEEAPEIRSVICLGTTTEAFSVSAAYDDFVRRPTGVVERDVGHGAFRCDVSARIDGGWSWQLGLYVAHHLAARGRLAQARGEAAGEAEGQTVDRWLWATGAVDHHCAVGPVEGLERKLAQSDAWFRAQLAAGIPVTLAIPEALAETPALAELPPGVELLTIAGTAPVLRAFGLIGAPDRAGGESIPAPSAPRPEWPASRVRQNAGRGILTGLVAVSMVLFCFGVIASAFDPALAGRAMEHVREHAVVRDVVRADPPQTALLSEAPAAPLPANLVIEWRVLRLLSGDRCESGAAARMERISGPSVSGRFCTVVAELRNQAGAPVAVDLAAGFVGRLRDYMRPDRRVERAQDIVQPGEVLTLNLAVPQWVRRDLEVRAVAISPPRTAGSGIQDEGGAATLDLLLNADPPTPDETVQRWALTLSHKRQ